MIKLPKCENFILAAIRKMRVEVKSQTQGKAGVGLHRIVEVANEAGYEDFELIEAVNKLLSSGLVVLTAETNLDDDGKGCVRKHTGLRSFDAIPARSHIKHPRLCFNEKMKPILLKTFYDRRKPGDIQWLRPRLSIVEDGLGILVQKAVERNSKPSLTEEILALME